MSRITLSTLLIDEAKKRGITLEQAFEEAVIEYTKAIIPGRCAKCFTWNRETANYCCECGNKLVGVSS